MQVLANWHKLGIPYFIKTTDMKRTKNTTENLSKQFDKELKALLAYDLKQFKSANGKSISTKPGTSQDKALLVA